MSRAPNYGLTHPPVEYLDDAGLELVEETIVLLRKARLSYLFPSSVRTYCKFMRVARAIDQLSEHYPTSTEGTREWGENIAKLYRERYPHLWTRIKKAFK